MINNFSGEYSRRLISRLDPLECYLKINSLSNSGFFFGGGGGGEGREICQK